MTRQLILVHGRAQQRQNPDDLKQRWVSSLKDGLAKNGLQLPIGDDDIRFPFYGDTLEQLTDDVPPGRVAEIVVRGTVDNSQEALFIRSVFMEMKDELGLTDQQVEDCVQEPGGVVERRIQNWGWVQAILEALDTHVPLASSASVALATRDVYRYLHNPGIRAKINLGVSRAFTSDVEMVVVGHSLGSIITYNLLKNEGQENGWKVPLYVTVGSPLAVRAIKEAVAPRKHPQCVNKWFNAMDHRDVVALYPLDQNRFRIDPPIENKTDVDNPTENRHGISGYLSDAIVAKRIHDALTGFE